MAGTSRGTMWQGLVGDNSVLSALAVCLLIIAVIRTLVVQYHCSDKRQKSAKSDYIQVMDLNKSIRSTLWPSPVYKLKPLNAEEGAVIERDCVCAALTPCTCTNIGTTKH